MRHFSGNGKEAIVVASYKQQYGGGAREEKQYTLLILGEGAPHSSSWYNESNIEKLVSPRCIEHLDLLEKHMRN